MEPLVEEIVSTPQDVVDLLEKGNASRRIGATDWVSRTSHRRCRSDRFRRTSVHLGHTLSSQSSLSLDRETVWETTTLDFRDW